MSGTRKRLLLLGCALVVGAAAIISVLPRPVHVAPVLRETFREAIVATGRVRPLGSSTAASQIDGTLAEVLVDVNARVSAGQLLAVITADDLAARAEEAVASADGATAERRDLEIVEQRLAEERVRSAAVRRRTAENDLGRAERLSQAGLVAASEVDRARAAAAAAVADERIADETAVAIRRTKRDRAVARERAARASARAVSAIAGHREVHSTTDGVVTKRFVDPGTVLRAGTPLFRIATSGPLAIDLVPDEAALRTLKVGQRAVVHADAYPDVGFSAVVARLDASVDPARGTVGVRLDPEAAPPFLRPDMTVSATIVTREEPQVLTVPTAAVREQSTPRPWIIVVERGRTVRREVVLGGSTGSRAVVRRGLSEGDAVVLDDIPPGTRVREIPATER